MEDVEISPLARYSMMSQLTLNLTLGTQARPDTGEVILSTAEETLTELTRTIAACFMARGRIHFGRDELDLALKDLDAALGYDPLNAEAIVLRSQIHLKRTDHYLAYKDIETALLINERDHEAIHTRGLLYQSTDRPEQAEADFRVARANYWSPPSVASRMHFEAGYHVVARYAALPSPLEVLISTYPLDGLSEALADADRYSYTPEDRQRLADDGIVEHPIFEGVVYEVRSVRREVRAYEPFDDEGNYIEEERCPLILEAPPPQFKMAEGDAPLALGPHDHSYESSHDPGSCSVRASEVQDGPREIRRTGRVSEFRTTFEVSKGLCTPARRVWLQADDFALPGSRHLLIYVPRLRQEQSTMSPTTATFHRRERMAIDAPPRTSIPPAFDESRRSSVRPPERPDSSVVPTQDRIISRSPGDMFDDPDRLPASQRGSARGPTQSPSVVVQDHTIQT